MPKREQVPSMAEIVRKGEAEMVRKAREVFRSSLVMGLEEVLGYENLAKLEAWFIRLALESYHGTMRSEIYLEAGLTILNASAWLAGLDLYEKTLVGFYERVGDWQERRAKETLVKLEAEIECAKTAVETCPQKLEELARLNDEVARFADKWIRPISNGVGESVGVAGGFGVMMLGIAGGAVGFAAGKMARRAFEVVKAKVRLILAGLARK